MSLRRLVSLMRGLGYTSEPVQRAPVPASVGAGVSSVDGVREVSPHDFVRALTNPQGFFGG